MCMIDVIKSNQVSGWEIASVFDNLAQKKSHLQWPLAMNWNGDIQTSFVWN